MVLNKTCLVTLLTSLLVACGGGGGGPGTQPVVVAPQTTIVQQTPQYSVTTNLGSVSYPNSYTTTSSNLLTASISDPCTLDIATLQYPKEWLGKFELPKINNAPLKKSFVRGMSLKDIMLHDNPGFVLDRGCKGDIQSEFKKTIDRLKILGVETIAVSQWHNLEKKADNSWYIAKADTSFGPMNDADLAFLIKIAHNAGMKVILYNQIMAMVDDTNKSLYVPLGTKENYSKWFQAYHNFILDRAVAYQSMGADTWEFGCSACVFKNTGDSAPETLKFFRQELIKNFNIVKQHYSGKLFMYTNALSWDYTNDFYFQNIDYLASYSWELKLTEEQNKNLTVASYKALLKDHPFYQSSVWWASLGKPIMIEFGIQSRTDALTNPGYVEETGCTGSMYLFDNTYPDRCIQKNVVVDFSLQAIVYQATLEAINELPTSNVTVISRDYWITDIMAPYTAYPNLSSSIRNKPAESILKMWYSK
jgi:hypothetical protein